VRHGLAGLVLALGSVPAFALAEPPAAGGGSDEPPRPTPSAPAEMARPAGVALYKLPAVGKPRRRIGGGRRGAGDALPDVLALVPDHVGLTASDEPSVFWYVSDTSAGPAAFELTVIHEGAIEPLVEVRLRAPTAKGVQRVDLGAHGVRLRAGEEYQWSLALVVDPEQRSRDLVATGWIERVAPPEALSAKLAAAGESGAAAVYAESGLWYDALASIWTLAQRRPGDAEPQRQLDALLAQVGLPALPLSLPR
jgi:hypothetical protein